MLLDAEKEKAEKSLFKKLKQHPAIYHPSWVVCYVTMLFFVSAAAKSVDSPANCCSPVPTRRAARSGKEI